MKVLILLTLAFGIGNMTSVLAQTNKSSGLLAYSQTLDIVEEQNDVWIACNKGLYKVNKQTLQYQHFSSQNSILPSNHIQTMSMAPDKTLWIGTYDLALLRIDDTGKWTSTPYPTFHQDGTALPAYQVYSSAVGKDGIVWLGTTIGLINYDGTRWTVLGNLNCPMSSAAVWDLEIDDHNKKIYIASYSPIIYDIRTNLWKDYLVPPLHDELAVDHPKIAKYGSNSLFYMFTDPVPEVAFKLTPGSGSTADSWLYWGIPQTQHNLLQPTLLPIAPCKNLVIQTDANNRLYYNTNSNILVYYDGSVWRQDHLVPNNNINLNSIDYFYIAQDGSFWLFEKNQLVHYDKNKNTHQSVTLNPYRSHHGASTARFANPSETQQEATIELTLFPNPATHSLSLKHDLGKFDRLHIVNTTGSTVLELNPKQTTINISQLPNGLYWMLAEQQDMVHKIPFVKEN